MSGNKEHVCPVGRAGMLDNRIRRCFQNPRKILGPYVKEGMTVLDIGCGPGFFSIDMAQMAGASGHVIACDLQEGMLEIVRDKMKGTELEERITLHKCEKNRIGAAGSADFALLFFLVHELPNKEAFFDELAALLRPNGKALMVEPPLHVSKAAFEAQIKTAEDAGFRTIERPKVLLCKAAILEKV